MKKGLRIKQERQRICKGRKALLSPTQPPRCWGDRELFRLL